MRTFKFQTHVSLVPPSSLFARRRRACGQFRRLMSEQWMMLSSIFTQLKSFARGARASSLACLAGPSTLCRGPGGEGSRCTATANLDHLANKVGV
ncbi:hypothetical protein GY45DRAFT_844033 [Cubamyces sp. BRFM 1775]|nr:hypothetical protein GY45DRAFT_844033 [Cubamyces sp. BRFM 1775]